jgi:hypothetical protein
VLLLTSARKRSLTRGLYALLAWHVNTAGLLRGLLRKRRSTARPIASRLIQDGPPGSAATTATPAHPSHALV